MEHTIAQGFETSLIYLDLIQVRIVIHLRLDFILSVRYKFPFPLLKPMIQEIGLQSLPISNTNLLYICIALPGKPKNSSNRIQRFEGLPIKS